MTMRKVTSMNCLAQGGASTAPSPTSRPNRSRSSTINTITASGKQPLFGGAGRGDSRNSVDSDLTEVLEWRDPTNEAHNQSYNLDGSGYGQFSEPALVSSASAGAPASAPRRKRNSLVKSMNRMSASFGSFQVIQSQGDASSGAAKGFGLTKSTKNSKSANAEIKSQLASRDKTQNYISNQKWSKLRKFLDTPEGQLGLNIEVSNGGEKMLHLVCQEHPPLDVVQTFYQTNPSWIASLDHDKRTPLHVAAAKGAHPAVVEFLLAALPCAASMVDSSGRTPMKLHQELCCQDQTCDPASFSQDEHDEHRNNTRDNMMDGNADMFSEFVIVNAYRTFGPILEVLKMLELAQKQEQDNSDCNGLTSDELKCITDACSRSSREDSDSSSVHGRKQDIGTASGKANAFASFLGTSPSDMSSLFEPVMPMAMPSTADGINRSCNTFSKPELSMTGQHIKSPNVTSASNGSGLTLRRRNANNASGANLTQTPLSTSSSMTISGSGSSSLLLKKTNKSKNSLSGFSSSLSLKRSSKSTSSSSNSLFGGNRKVSSNGLSAMLAGK